MTNKVTFNKEAKEGLLKGVNTVADAVKVTMGANGRSVVIGDKFGNTHTTKDGVTVARSIMLEDYIENIGASLIKEVSNQTVIIAGDGTTTSTVLAQKMIQNGLDAIDSGYNPVWIKSGMEKASKKVVSLLKSLSKEVVDNDTIIQIATVSANNDSVIGNIIGEAVEKIGRDGLILVEQGTVSNTIVDVVEGMSLDTGYISHYFITDQKKMSCEMVNPYVFMYDRTISSIQTILPILEKISKEARPLLIIADNVDGEALATLVLNKLNSKIQVCAIKCPEFGNRRIDVMNDLVSLVGGQYVSVESGIDVSKSDVNSVLGVAKKVNVFKDSVTIIGDNSNDTVKERVVQIKTETENCSSDNEMDFLKKRLAKLTGGVAIIKVGGYTETELKEKKDRIDDAVCATKSAIDEGYLAGGGTSFLFCNDIDIDCENESEKIGVEIVYNALKQPFIQILLNSGHEYENYINDVFSNGYGYGLNVKTNKIENLFESGIIDSTKVCRVCVENSVSIASVFLTTECVISPKQ